MDCEEELYGEVLEKFLDFLFFKEGRIVGRYLHVYCIGYWLRPVARFVGASFFLVCICMFGSLEVVRYGVISSLMNYERRFRYAMKDIDIMVGIGGVYLGILEVPFRMKFFLAIEYPGVFLLYGDNSPDSL